MKGPSRRAAAALACVLALACRDDAAVDEGASEESESSTSESESGSEGSDESSTGTDDAMPEQIERWVEVHLDGAPIEGASVMQGGVGVVHITGADGRVLVTVDTTIPGDIGLIASHPLARTLGQFVSLTNEADMLFELESFEVGDNTEYVFNPPGHPDEGGTTLECGHCHDDLKDDWYASPHRTSASNPMVQDIYAGAAHAFGDQASCEAAGGQWWAGLEPGTGAATSRCYLGAGALPDLNEGCGDMSSCDELASEFGQCADCHAPAIDGAVGGRDLLEATGVSYEAGVHCDLCHKVESIDLEAPPGVAGRLRLNRPLEPSMSPGVGLWAPLAFGPYADVPNPRMGASPRQHFLTAEFCAGCHQHDQPALVPGTTLDPQRWPQGVLPAHSTYQEWRDGPFGDNAPCSSCHMPADPVAGNSADMRVDDIPEQGFAKGWLRPPGSVRQHTWVGPRTVSSGMLQLAAAVFVDTSVEGGVLTAELTVRNVGAGHAIPTGEPLRSLVLFVQARCGDEILTATGGDAVPEFGGWLDRKPSPEDWAVWPGAEVGDVIRVVVDEGWHDYEGFGPFGDGSFAPADKGLPQLKVVGQATVTAVNGDLVTLDQPLPPGDVAYRGHADAFASGDPSAAAAVAGAPGFAFARVLADDQGARMVPHHRAVDVVSDNRILPQSEWTSVHVFATTCADPVVDAVLVHRAYPVDLATQRGWDNPQQVMVEVSK